MADRSNEALELYLRDLGGDVVRTRSWTYGALIWIGLLILALSLGVAGFVRVDKGHGVTPYVPDLLYRALQLFFLQFNEPAARLPWQLETARWLAPGLAGYAIYKGLEAVLRERFQRFGVALRYRGHVILCGLSRKAVRLATAYRKQGRSVVILEKDPKHPMIDVCRDRGIAVLVGDATRPETLRQGQLVRAERLIALAPDLTNLEISFQVERLLSECGTRSQALPCFVHIGDSVVCRNLRDAEVSRDRSLIVREFFNVNEIGARAMSDWKHCPVFPEGQAGQTHIQIVGFGAFGEALLLELARRWSDPKGLGITLLPMITVVDPRAADGVEMLRRRFPWIDLACILRPVTLTEHDPDFDACEFLASGDSPPPTQVYVVPEDEKMGLRAALRLWQRRHSTGEHYPIILRTDGNPGLARLLPGGCDADSSAAIDVFDLLQHSCSPNLLVPSLELLARAIHERYLEQRQAHGFTMGSRPAMCPWEELAEFYRESNRQQAARLARTLEVDPRRRYDIVQTRRSAAATFVFPPDDVERLARNEHDRFRAHRKLTEPDHPDLVPWEQLSEESRQVVRQQILDWPKVLARVDLTLIERLTSSPPLVQLGSHV